MPSINIIRVSEFEKLYYNDEKPFKQKHWEALCRYHDKANKHTEYFRILNRGIQFLQYVGVIQAGDLTIEVLPKTDRSHTTAANESWELTADDNKEQWHGALLQMLQECRFLQVNSVGYAYLKLRSHSILDMYLEMFLIEAEHLLHEGLVKKYDQQQGNQPALKGRLVFQKHLAHNITHAERFYVDSPKYNHNNIYNQIIYTTVQLIRSISNNNSYLLHKARQLLLCFPELTPITATANTFTELTYDRKTERYKAAMQIAGMLLLHYRPDIAGGTEYAIAILFDMNKLWEEWVYRQLKKEERAAGISVHRQQSENFWKGDNAHHYKTIRPDIVIKKEDSVIILDTKWKIVESMTPADEDLKQMFVYNLYWQSTEGFLLYPATQEAGLASGHYAKAQHITQEVGNCKVITQSIFDEYGKLDKLFGNRVLQKVLL